MSGLAATQNALAHPEAPLAGFLILALLVLAWLVFTSLLIGRAGTGPEPDDDDPPAAQPVWSVAQLVSESPPSTGTFTPVTYPDRASLSRESATLATSTG